VEEFPASTELMFVLAEIEAMASRAKSEL